MKKLLLAMLVALAATLPAYAQVAGGNISGTVTDEQGAVLPGVTVTIQGSDRTQEAITDGSGKYRFLNLPPGAYKITAALTGFSTLLRENVVVAVGRDVDIPFQMKVAALQETITVSGEAPVIDTKATGTATNFTADELTKIPTSRDPFALMRSVPGVLVDRVNIGGNETGQQSNFSSKGTRPQDAVWTMDGIVITDMAAVGASPTYFNYDNFEEVQVATAGQDIKQPTGGMGLNFVVKRGTNAFHGGFRGYFDNDAMEGSNVPDELKALGVTAETTDHNKQISDIGYDIGGPIFRDKAWFYHSYSLQDVRLVRRAGALIDRTQLKNPNVKINWQATKKDMFSFLYFDGFKIKDGRSPGDSGILFDASTATWHQDNAYDTPKLHGLWKIADDRVFSSNLYVSAKYAYYNTGFQLSPVGGLDQQAGQDFISGRSYGSTRRSLNVRPQHILNIDSNSFLNGAGGSHDLKYGFGWRQADGRGGTLWPGNMILGIANSATNMVARVYREGFGGNRVKTMNFYAGDTISRNRLTVDLGLRYDRQWGQALPSETQSNKAFPNLVPGIKFDGYASPFTWNNVSPRGGLTYALDEARKTVARASYARYAGQIDTGIVGFMNPSSSVGFADYRWIDANGDHFAQADEVQLNQFLAPGGGFDPANPTAVASANRIDPDLKAPVTQSIVVGMDRELIPAVALSMNYSYTRTSDLIGNFTNNYQPWIGVGLNNYLPGPTAAGTLPDGTTYSVPTYIPDPAVVTANGSGRLLTNQPDYYTTYSGLEFGVTKRLSNRWMSRLGFAFNNATEHYPTAESRRDSRGNPTPLDTEPLKDGGLFAPRSGGSGAGDVFINARWSFNANAMYQAPYGIEVSGNLFGRQGYAQPYFQNVALGRDGTQRVLVSPEIDSTRFPNLWNLDVRAAKQFEMNKASARFIFDVFNVMNANTDLVRNRNAAATGTARNALAQNLSPRIARVGVVIGF